MSMRMMILSLKEDYDDCVQADMRGGGRGSLREELLLPCLLVGNHFPKGPRL